MAAEWLHRLTSTLGAACSRRRRPEEAAEPAFWEDAPGSKGGDEAEEAEQANGLGFEQASHLKDEGKEKFARGDVSEAMDCWVHALDALCLPPEQPEGEEEPPPRPLEDPRARELRITLLLNLALGHKKLKQWRHTINYCEEVLVEQPKNVKALYNKIDALGELCTWREAEEFAAKLEDTGEEGKKLAVQKREEWRRRQRAADGRQKKMWSAALAETAPQQAGSSGKPPELRTADVQEAWVQPKVEQMSVFDLRRKGIEWVEAEDFDDVVWKDGLGQRDAVFYQRRALPLSLLAAAALAEVELRSELVVHCILDGNTAPFAEPHDWSAVLQRCPGVRSLTVVYVDIGAVGGEGSGEAPPPMPYGTLLRPTEEGRVGDRVARAARFLGTYREFQEHCRDLPGLVAPQLALWADVPLFGFGDDDFATRLEAYELLSAAGAPSVVTQGSEVPHRGGPPMAPKISEQASLSMAILGLGLRAATIGGWHWNRFVVPLDRGSHGILAAHALLGVLRPAAKDSVVKPATVKEALRRRGIAVTPYKYPNLAHDEELEKLRRRQWEAFCQQMRAAGRPVGPEADEQERNRQSMEFYQFCGMTEPPPP